MKRLFIFDTSCCKFCHVNCQYGCIDSWNFKCFRLRDRLPWPAHFSIPDLTDIEATVERQGLPALKTSRVFVGQVLTPIINKMMLYIDKEVP